MYSRLLISLISVFICLHQDWNCGHGDPNPVPGAKQSKLQVEVEKVAFASDEKRYCDDRDLIPEPYI